MNITYLLRINLTRIFVIISLSICPSIASSDSIGNFANKLFNHYEYDDKVNNYLKSFFLLEIQQRSHHLKINKIFLKTLRKFQNIL